MAELTTMQSVKQSTRNFMHKASDKMKVTGAKVSGGDTKALDIAIVKATTSNLHVVPKEKHVRTLKSAVHGSSPRRDVSYVISELHQRLQDSTDWLTALKTLITIHRLMRETDSSFLEELMKLNAHVTQGRGRLLNMDNFIDRTNIEGRFEYSEWVRAYGKYLDCQLEVYSTINWYVEVEQPGNQSRLRTMGARELLYQLPFLQRLQRRLLDCVPRGQAARDHVVLYALTLLVKESFTMYKAVSEGIINLADTFFEMDYLDAVKGLDLYKESIASNEALATYYATIEQIEEVKRSMQLPKLSAPPVDFVKSMEAYLQDAPRPTDGGPTRKGAPLRKGKLSQSTKRAGGGPTSEGGPRDPGMVLPMGVPAPSLDQPPSPTQAPLAPPTTAPAASADDLLGFGELSLQGSSGDAGAPLSATSASPAAPKPSAMDLLSGLDFSYQDDSVPHGGAHSYPPQPSPSAAPPSNGAVSSNPFSTAPFQLQQQQSYPQHTAYPYGPDGFQAYPGTAGGFPVAGQLQQGQMQLGQVGASDFGLPSPSMTGSRASPGGVDSLRSSSSNPLRASGNGFLGTPLQSPGDSSNVSLFKAAGAHDPFASLTGLPKAGTPGSNKPSPSKYSPSVSPNTSTGNLFI